MMHDFVRLLGGARRGEVPTGAGISVDSHLMALAAEEARLSGETIDFVTYKKNLMEEVQQ